MSRDEATRRLPRLVFAGASVVLVGWYLHEHPMAELQFEPHAITRLRPRRLAEFSATMGWLLLINLAAAGLGARLGRLLGTPPRELRVPVTLGLGLLGLSIAVLALALLRQLHEQAFALLLVGCAALGAPWLRTWRSWRRPPRTPTPHRVWGLAAGLLLLPALLSAFLGYPGWDALMYHLALAERYLFENRIFVSPLSLPSAYPAAAEMLFTLALGVDGQALAQLLHLEFGVLTAWAVAALAGRVSARAGLLAVGILAADPLFAWEMLSVKNDLVAALYTLLAVALLHEVVDREQRQLALLCGVFLGGAAAVRYSSWALGPVLLAAAWLPPWRLGTRERLHASLLIGTAALVVLAPWPLRNLVATGNPVTPALQQVFHSAGNEFFHPVSIEQNAAFLRSIGMGQSLGKLVALPWNLTMRAEPGSYSHFGFVIGSLYLVGGLAILLAWRRLPSEAVRYGEVALPLFLIWFFTSQEPRYLLPALMCLSVVAGIAADALVPRSRAASIAAVAVLAVAVLHVHAPYVVRLPRLYGQVFGTLPSSALFEAEPSRELADEARKLLGSGDRLLLLFETRGYLYRGLDYIPYHMNEGSPILHLVHESGGSEDLRDRLRDLGATHLVLNAEALEHYRPFFVPAYRPEDFLADLRRIEVFLERHTTLVASRGRVELRAIVPPAGSRVPHPGTPAPAAARR